MTGRATKLVATVGIAVGAGVSIVYATRGYRPALPLLLLVAVVITAFAFRGPTRSEQLSRSDIGVTAALAILFCPLYSFRVYTIPWQVNTDEITLMSIAREYLVNPRPDWFSISYYFGCPAAAFIFFGRLANGIGGIDLFHVRLIHSLIGIACVLAAYWLFRLTTSVRIAATAAIILGANHSLIAYSRMGMWSDSALLLEVLALFFLIAGLKRNSLRSLFLSGVSAGVAFYVYFPGRIAIALALVMLVIVSLRETERPLARLLSRGSLIVLGWMLVAAPVMIATAKNHGRDTQYQREQLMIYPEGRAQAEKWTNTHTPVAAWKANAKLGLETFNTPVVDHGWLYPNYNHGFVDPLTGVLVWIGVFAILLRVFKGARRSGAVAASHEIDRNVADVMSLTCFAILYFSLALIVTKAPNYQRLLMILPFAGYLAAAGVWSLYGLVSAHLLPAIVRPRKRLVSDALGILTLGTILVLNVNTFRDFTVSGRVHGHEVGSTGRIVESRQRESGHMWILAADKQHLYYFWGEPWWWRGWLGFFAAPNQPVQVVSPDKLAEFPMPNGATVFASSRVWATYGAALRSAHNVTAVSSVVPDGHLVAAEVKAGQ